ncbi:MAG: GTPase [Anaerovoracaceae bacterium]
MERGNVLVIGNSGVGKSTLINAVIGDEIAETGWGTRGTTRVGIYESDKIPFRLIDTIGFEPSLLKARKAIGAVKKWSQKSAKEGNKDNQINVIWFCVEGTTRKLFPKAIKDLLDATSMWKTVPVVVVITKSYSLPDREENIAMVNKAFAKQKRHAKNLRRVIPVVASTYVLNDNAFAPPEGITELIDVTNELMPEGIKAGAKDIASFKINRKRAMAHGTTGVATTAAVVVGAVPIPYPDAAILVPLEVTLVNGLAQIYGINKNEDSKKLINTIVEIGTVSLVARQAINMLKAIPGVNLGASALNALIAGSIVAAIGEGSIYVFEQIYLGNKTVGDIDWVKKVMESKLTSQFVDAVKAALEKITDSTDKKDIAKIIIDVFKTAVGGSGGKK